MFAFLKALLNSFCKVDCQVIDIQHKKIACWPFVLFIFWSAKSSSFLSSNDQEFLYECIISQLFHMVDIYILFYFLNFFLSSYNQEYFLSYISLKIFSLFSKENIHIYHMTYIYMISIFIVSSNFENSCRYFSLRVLPRCSYCTWSESTPVCCFKGR